MPPPSPVHRRVGLAAALSWTLVVLMVLTGCSTEPSQPLSSSQPVTEAPTPATPPPDLDAAAEAAANWTRAVRDHDAGAIYDLAWSGLRKGTRREDFVAGFDLDGVTDARLSGVLRVGWSEDGKRAAVAPVVVTSDKIPQIGRVVFLLEDGEWRFFNQVEPGQEPLLTDTPPG